jgi:hypothetical protein
MDGVGPSVEAVARFMNRGRTREVTASRPIERLERPGKGHKK